MIQPEGWALDSSLIVFALAVITVLIGGVGVTLQAEHLSRDTGLGQAITGAVFLGAMTSLSGLVTSLSAAWDGHAQLSFSNAVGGIAVRTGLSEGIVGTLFTATTTSLPEAVIAVAAVRRGALALAVGNIIGGNTFDVLFLSFSDLAFRGGSIYHAVSAEQYFWLAMSLLMSAVLLLGLVRRETHGIGNIGFESVLVLVFYLGGVLLMISA